MKIYNNLGECMKEHYAGDEVYSNIYYECDVKRHLKSFERYLESKGNKEILDKYMQEFGVRLLK